MARLGECDTCGLVLELVGDRVALHTCLERGDPQDLIHAAAADPELDFEQAALAAIRGALLGVAKGDSMNLAHLGDLIEGVSKLKGVGGDGDAMSALKHFLTMGEEEGAEE